MASARSVTTPSCPDRVHQPVVIGRLRSPQPDSKVILRGPRFSGPVKADGDRDVHWIGLQGGRPLPAPAPSGKRFLNGIDRVSLDVGRDLHLHHLVRIRDRTARRARRRLLELVDDIHALHHLADHGVLIVEEGGVAEADEELAVG